jgi:hypothetical protein
VTIAARTVDNGSGTDYDVLVDNITSDSVTGDAQVVSGPEVIGDAVVGRPLMVGSRADTTIPAAVDDGDVQVPWLNPNGAQWAIIAPRPRSTWYDLVTQASAVAALDQLCDEVELTSMSLVAGGGGQLDNMVLTSDNLTIISAELWLYQVNPTAAGTNSVHDLSDANAQTARPMGVIDFNSWRTTTSNMQSSGTYCGVPLTLAGLQYQCLDGTNTTSLWGILMTRTAVTPGATTDYNLMVTHVPGV